MESSNRKRNRQSALAVDEQHLHITRLDWIWLHRYAAPLFSPHCHLESLLRNSNDRQTSRGISISHPSSVETLSSLAGAKIAELSRGHGENT